MVIDDWNTLDVYFANTTKHQYMTIASDYANNTDFACGKNLCLYDITNPLGVIAINVTSAGQCMPPYCFKGPNHFYASKIPFDINHFLNSRHYVMSFANITLGECNMGEPFLKCLTGDCGGFIITPNGPPPNTTNPVAQIPIRGIGPNNQPATTVVHFPGTQTGTPAVPGNTGSGNAGSGSNVANLNQNPTQNSNSNPSSGNSGGFKNDNAGAPAGAIQSNDASATTAGSPTITSIDTTSQIGNAHPTTTSGCITFSIPWAILLLINSI